MPSGKPTVRGLSLLLCACALLAPALFAPAPASAESASVAALQVALRSMGLYHSSIDGVTGPLTRRGVRVFQRHHHLHADGIAGPHTRLALGRRGRPLLGKRVLQSGSRGWDVAALQFLLARRGFGPHGFDGGFGANTADAVRRFQRASGLGVDGVVGRATLARLRGRRVFTYTRRRSSGVRRTTSQTVSGTVMFFRPVNGPEGDGFGYPGGRRHTGIDFPQPFGAPIHAAGVGVVTFAGWNSGGYGNLTVISHRLGWETWYAHQSRFAVHVGQHVNGGDIIGYVGSTGHSTGPHVHFETRLYGTPVNPEPRLLSAAAASLGGGTAFHARTGSRKLVCRSNGDAWGSQNADPAYAHTDRCP